MITESPAPVLPHPQYFPDDYLYLPIPSHPAVTLFLSIHPHMTVLLFLPVPPRQTVNLILPVPPRRTVNLILPVLNYQMLFQLPGLLILHHYLQNCLLTFPDHYILLSLPPPRPESLLTIPD